MQSPNAGKGKSGSKGGKKVSTNPAKRAQQEREAAQRAAQGGGSAFGGGQPGAAKGGQAGAFGGDLPDLGDIDPAQLPKELRGMFGSGR